MSDDFGDIRPLESRWLVDCCCPMTKLVYVYLDDLSLRVNYACGGERLEKFEVNRDRLEAACGIDRGDATAAVLDLHHRSLIELVSYDSEHFDISMMEPLSPEKDPESLGVFHRDHIDQTHQKHLIENSFSASGAAREPRPPWKNMGHRRRARLWERQNGKCWYCGCGLAVHESHWTPSGRLSGRNPGWEPKPGYSYPAIEHQTPRSRGGANDGQNIVLSCSTCNARKLDRGIEEFRELCAAKGWASPVVFHGETLSFSIAGYNRRSVQPETQDHRP